MNSQQLTALHRRQQLALRRTVLADMEKVWPKFRWAELDESFPAFASAVSKLVTQRRRTSASLSAAYFRGLRVAAGLAGNVRIVTPKLEDWQLVGSLHATTVSAAKKHSARGESEQKAMPLVLGLASGAMVTHVLNGGRQTIGATLQADPQVRGWRRVLGGGGCDFCQAAVGEYPASTPDFEVHDRCGCQMEPLF